MKNWTLTKLYCNIWIEALRSGHFKRCKNRLSSSNQHGNYYNVLGVAEMVCDFPRLGKSLNESTLHPFISGLSLKTQLDILDYCERYNANFEKVADYIQAVILPNCPETA